MGGIVPISREIVGSRGEIKEASSSLSLDYQKTVGCFRGSLVFNSGVEDWIPRIGSHPISYMEVKCGLRC